jgi:hypothetical protein
VIVEFLIFLLAWVVPLGGVLFLLIALWQIVRNLNRITMELARIRQALDRDRPL